MVRSTWVFQTFHYVAGGTFYARSPGVPLAVGYTPSTPSTISYRSVLLFFERAPESGTDTVRSCWPVEVSAWLTLSGQAQYYRDPAQLETYLKSNTFLADVNNEVPGGHNGTYSDNLASLNALVLVLFSADKTVVPKESSWFGSYAPSNTSDEKTVVPMRLQPLYTQDWIGLRTLDQSGRVVMETCEGEHMQLTDECWKPLVQRFVGNVLDHLDYIPDDAVLRVQDQL